MREERAKNKSRRDDMIIAQGKRSATLGKEPNMNTSLFPSFVFSRLQAWKKQNSGKGRPGGVPWCQPRAAARLRYAPAGLALGYYLTAPSGRRSSARFYLLAPDLDSRKSIEDLIRHFIGRPRGAGWMHKVQPGLTLYGLHDAKLRLLRLAPDPNFPEELDFDAISTRLGLLNSPAPASFGHNWPHT